MRTLKALSTKVLSRSLFRRRAGLLALAVAGCLLASVASAAAAVITVSGAGTGSGVVTVTGATKGTLITCTITVGVASGTCSATFGLLEVDTVTVAPGAGSVFAQWSSSTGGGSNTCTGTANPCTLKASPAAALTAELEKPAVAGVTTNTASNVTIEGAQLNGSLQPEGSAAEYFFEYGTTTAYGRSTTTKTSAANVEVLASEALLGLAPLTTYHYRLVAKRVIEGVTRESVGKDETLTTGGVSPEVESEGVSAITPFSATLAASIDPGNSSTSYLFLYGASPADEQAAVPAGLLAGYGDIPVDPRVLQGLQPDTTYYFHVVAENAFGRVEDVEGPAGPEEGSFTTLPASAPGVSLAPVAEASSSTATLLAAIDPHGLASEYEIELGEGGSFAVVVVQSAGAGEAALQLSYALSALAPGSEYEVRVRAWNAAGEAVSATQSFATAAALAPALTPPLTPPLLSAAPVSVEAKGAPKPAGTKTLTKAQKLSRALKLCAQKPKRRRAACRKAARRRHRSTRR